MDQVIGTIIIFAGNFEPKGWAFCNGQTLQIASNTALFSIIGTTYGGDGVRTFQLPDLRGRVAVSAGQGNGLSNYSLGQQAGAETVTLDVSQMPIHNHQLQANNNAANPSFSPSATYPSLSEVPRGGAASAVYATSVTAPVTMNQAVVTSNGGSKPHNNIQPLLAINYIIATQGIFPSRD